MRLIDADKFKTFIQKKYKDGEKTEDIKDQMLFDLSYQQTAYDVDKVVEQIKTLSPANYVSKDDVLRIVKGDHFSPNSEKNSFFNFDEVLRIECEKARSKAIDDIVIKIKECVGMDWEWDFMFIEQIAEQLKKGVGE